MSQVHCRLFIREDTLFVEDLGSTNGVKVNGHRVSQQPLQPGDEITLGLERLVFEVE